MEEFIEIGEIVRAHGINGELKIKKITADPDRYRRLKVVYIDGNPYKISQMRDAGEFVYLRFSGITDRNAAESFKGKYVSVDRVNAIDLDDDEYFIADLIGCKLITQDGEELGKIKEILSFGAADVIEAESDKGVLRFPFLKKIIAAIDIDSKIFTVKREEWEQVVVYED